MSVLAKVGERLYEFDTNEDLTKARALYVQANCSSQSALEDLMDEAGVEFFIEDLDGLFG
jgi:hypothetical protein